MAKHNEKIWNAPRKVRVNYERGWEGGRTVFHSLACCEKHLKEKFGDDTSIELLDEEVEDAASVEVITKVCGNYKRCAFVTVE